jgi:hypothetical protein
VARLFARGSSEYLENASAVVTPWPISLVGWFRSDDATVEQAILCVGDTGSTNNFLSMLLRGDVGGDYLQAYSKNGDDKAITTSGYTSGKWHHGAAVFTSASSRTAYIDGANSATNTDTSNDAGLDATAIGRHNDSTPGDYFDGALCELGVYNVALTAGEVAMLAALYSPLFVRPESLVAYYSLIRDDLDRVGGYDMTPYNTPAYTDHPPIIYPSPQSVVYVAAAVNAMPMAMHHYRMRRV